MQCMSKCTHMDPSYKIRNPNLTSKQFSLLLNHLMKFLNEQKKTKNGHEIQAYFGILYDFLCGLFFIHVFSLWKMKWKLQDQASNVNTEPDSYVLIGVCNLKKSETSLLTSQTEFFTGELQKWLLVLNNVCACTR